MNYRKMTGVSPGATIGDMIVQSRQSAPKMQKPRAPKREMNSDAIRTTVDFRPSPVRPRGRGGMR
jgi:hypothetical protein